MAKVKGKTVKMSKKKGDGPVVAKSEDGTIQITFNIPFESIKITREEVLIDLASQIDIPGFRKGKAPLEKVKEKVSQKDLLEKTLSSILPKLFAEALNKHKLKPAIYPKFELLKANDDEDWQVRATTCEIPEFELGDYKTLVSGVVRAGFIWTPEKSDKKKEKVPSKEEKEQEIINALIKNIKVNIPKLLVEEEVNLRLSRLLERLEKLGLDLDSYLASINKTSQSLREDYEKQSGESITLELIIAKIAENEKIEVDEEELEKTLEMSSAGQSQNKNTIDPRQKDFIRSIIQKRKVLDYLVSLI